MMSRVRALAERAIYIGITVIIAVAIAFTSSAGWEAVSR
jgi:hypothetical protein